MSFTRKLKPEISISILLPAVVTLTGLVVLWAIVGRTAAYGFVAVVFLVYAVLSMAAFVRTRNTGYFAAALFQLFGGLWIGGLHQGIFFISERLTAFFPIAAVLFGAWMQVLLFTRRFKWRGREILELAAQPVKDTTDGFTRRPRPTGWVACSEEEMAGFAQFVAKNLIANPHLQAERLVLVPITMAQSVRYLYAWNRDYREDTWVSFDREGKVDVHVARRDYVKFQESLSFDQLCQSLGDLFVDILELYRRGEGTRIIDRLNAVREHPYV